MGRILSPQLGQRVWTVTNGEPSARIYAGPSKCLSGHLLRVPGLTGHDSYYISHLLAYEHESDILELHLTSAREAVLQAEQRLASLKRRYQDALDKERSLVVENNWSQQHE